MPTTIREQQQADTEEPLLSSERAKWQPWKGQNLSQKHTVEWLLHLSTFYIQGTLSEALKAPPQGCPS